MSLIYIYIYIIDLVLEDTLGDFGPALLYDSSLYHVPSQIIYWLACIYRWQVLVCGLTKDQFSSTIHCLQLGRMTRQRLTRRTFGTFKTSLPEGLWISQGQRIHHPWKRYIARTHRERRRRAGCSVQQRFSFTAREIGKRGSRSWICRTWRNSSSLSSAPKIPHGLKMGVCVCHLGSPELLLPWSLDEDAGSAGTLMINCTVLRVNLTQNMTKQSRWSGSIHSHLNWARSVDLGPAIGLRLGGVYVYETNSISMCIILILHSAVRQVWPLGKQKARNSGQALSLSLSRWVYINWPTGSLYRCWEVH